ncbi:MAG: zinc metallopeptidase [Spirochaetes bacterium]|nr:zinc metallopeptidase [Spirochaetota bacterium]
MFFWDSTFLLIIPAFILALWAQSRVKSAYSKWARVRTRRGITGADMAEKILSGNGIDVPVKEIAGELTDNYDPIKKSLNLSQGVFGSDSVAAVGIAAHEAGHAIQHSKGYAALKFRNGIFPVARFGSNLGFFLFFIGLIMGYNKLLMDIGIYLFTAFVAFTIITLPVEFNASKRAVAILQSSGYLDTKEITGVKEVLSAAAWTYVASATMAIMQLLRLLILRGRD